MRGKIKFGGTWNIPGGTWKLFTTTWNIPDTLPGKFQEPPGMCQVVPTITERSHTVYSWIIALKLDIIEKF